MANDGVIIGPVSESLQPLLDAPVVSLLQYSLPDGKGKLRTVWSNIEDSESYITTVEATDGSFKKNIPSIDPNSTLMKDLDPQKSYEVRVVAMSDGGVIVGPFSDTLLAVVASPEVSLLQYTLPLGNGVLQTNWSDVKNATSYITTVQAKDGSFKKNIPSTEPNSQLEKTLPVKIYDVTVTGFAEGGIVVGPTCTALHPIVEMPVIKLLHYTLPEGSGLLQTDWGIIEEAESYVTTVQAKDGSFKKNIPSTEPNSQLAKTLPVKVYDVTVIGIAQGGVVLGPANEALHPIVEVPTLSLVDYTLSEGGRLVNNEMEHSRVGTDLYHHGQRKGRLLQKEHTQYRSVLYVE